MNKDKFLKAMDEAIANAPDEATAEALRKLKVCENSDVQTLDSGGHGGTVPGSN